MKNSLLIPAAFILLMAMLLVNSCLPDDGDNNEYPNVTATSDTIIGVLKYKPVVSSETPFQKWPFGAATLNVLVGKQDILASAVVDSTGNFTLILPASVSGSALSSLSDVGNFHKGDVKATPATVRYIPSILFKVAYMNKGIADTITMNLHTFNTDLTINKSYYYSFYDLEGTFAGTGDTGSVFDWTFKKGWGIIESSVISSNDHTFSSRSVVEIPADAFWVNF